jgi:hypothetical protein
MTNEHIMFLVNMTLEKPPHGENQLEIDVYIWRSQSMSTTRKTNTSEPGTIATKLGCFGVPCRCAC